MWPFEGEREQLLTVWPHQEAGLELAKTHSIVAMHGSVQNGKSQWLNLSGMQRVLRASTQPPPHSDRIFWVTVPTRAPYWHNFQPVFEKCWGWVEEGGMILSRNETLAKYVIRAADGGKPWTCWVRYADDPDTFRTSSVDFILATEAALYKPEIFALMQFRVAKMNGPIYMDTSPNGLGWFWKEIIERASVTLDFRPTARGEAPVRTTRTMEADPRIALVNGVPVMANRFMQSGTLQIMRENMSGEQWRREGLGEAFASSGLVLNRFNPLPVSAGGHVTPDVTPAELGKSRAQWGLIGGIDWGWDHPGAHVWVAVSHGRYWVVDEFRESGMTVRKHAEAWKSNEWDSWVKWRYADPSRPDAIEELADYKIGATGGNNDVDLGINRLNQLFEQGKLKIAARCVKLIDEIGTWQRNPKTSKPSKLGEDLLAALRYAVYSHSLAEDGAELTPGLVEKGGRVRFKGRDGTEQDEVVSEIDESQLLAEDGTVKEIV